MHNECIHKLQHNKASEKEKLSVTELLNEREGVVAERLTESEQVNVLNTIKIL